MAERLLQLVALVARGMSWTAQKAGITAATTWAATTETHKSVTGKVRVKVEPVSGTGNTGTVKVYASELPVEGASSNYTDIGLVTAVFDVPPTDTLKVLVTTWAGTGEINLHIQDV